jgi:endonuclease-3
LLTALCAQLKRDYPDAKCALEYETPFQLLVATILSAQCTDARVNMVTPALFRRFPDPKSLAGAKIAEIEELIRSTGFFRNKAKNIKSAATKIVERFAGVVPRTMDELLSLAGVARKTANVVLGNAFDVPGLPVDTHVIRLSTRLGVSKSADPVVIEREITAELPEGEWTMFTHRMIAHGRAVCDARKPKCDDCSLSPLCPKIGVKPTSKPEATGRKRSADSKDDS